MKLKRREKILASLAGGMLGVAALGLVFLMGDSRSTDRLLADRDKLLAEIKSKDKTLTAGARDAKRLAEWNRRSLPSNPTVARSLYQTWLRRLASQTSLRSPTIISNEIGGRRDVFSRISFTLRARASLGDLVEFLYEFYSVGYLHQIRKMDIKPMSSFRELDVNLTIEALALPGADTKNQLPKEAGHGLRLTSLAEYRDAIVSRNLFAPPSPSFRNRTVQAAEYAFITGITQSDGVSQVWLQDRMAGKQWILKEGESFEVGNIAGKVQAITTEGDVMVEYDGHRRRLRDGDNLYGGAGAQDRENEQSMPVQPPSDERSVIMPKSENADPPASK